MRCFLDNIDRRGLTPFKTLLALDIISVTDADTLVFLAHRAVLQCITLGIWSVSQPEATLQRQAA